MGWVRGMRAYWDRCAGAVCLHALGVLTHLSCTLLLCLQVRKLGLQLVDGGCERVCVLHQQQLHALRVPGPRHNHVTVGVGRSDPDPGSLPPQAILGHVCGHLVLLPVVGRELTCAGNHHMLPPAGAHPNSHTGESAGSVHRHTDRGHAAYTGPQAA